MLEAKCCACFLRSKILKGIFVNQAMASCKDGKTSSVMDNGKYVRYTPEQVEALERLYHDCPKPSSMRRQQLIRECPILSHIEPKQIKVWFQNRRYYLYNFLYILLLNLTPFISQITFFEFLAIFSMFFLCSTICTSIFIYYPILLSPFSIPTNYV